MYSSAPVGSGMLNWYPGPATEEAIAISWSDLAVSVRQYTVSIHDDCYVNPYTHNGIEIASIVYREVKECSPGSPLGPACPARSW